MNLISQLLERHPSFHALLTKVENAAGNNYLEKIYVTGLPAIFQDDLQKLLEKHLQLGIIALERDNQELLRYFDTIEIIDLKTISRQSLINFLQNNNYLRVPKVSDLGEYNFLGDNVMFWSPGYQHPIKVSFFGEEMEQALVYDEVYGTKISLINQCILGEMQKLESKSLFSAIKIPHQDRFAQIILINTQNLFNNEQLIRFDFNYAELFFGKFSLLSEMVSQKVNVGFTIYLDTVNPDALPEHLQRYCIQVEKHLEAGFISESLKIYYLTDRELFGTLFLSKQVSKLSSNKARQLLASLEGEIEMGDYIVHEDYGIGIYQGLKQEIQKKEIKIGFGEFRTIETREDYLVIAYAAGDELMIPLTQIDKLTKYINPESEAPVITRLGKNDWQRIRTKVKASVRIMASELVEHYAKRALAKAKPVDSHLSEAYQQFVVNFPYQETPDQQKVEKEVLVDLSKSMPMNRLLVGDVGFGKTEIAMRAAFKMVETGRQVAILCPTTVLTAQHLKVFTDRFQDTRFIIRGFSRMHQEQAQANLQGMLAGKVDIVIGTHRLLSSDIQFKDLGLIIIDEEQKFGVKQKEKLKKLAYGVHVLNLSATPIPRSLSMALSAIQDISLIQTPPEGRKAIETFVEPLTYPKIVEAIKYEVNRGGQIYYLHNQVSTIESTLQKLHKLLPDVKFIVAHGQLSGNELEERIEKFYNQEYDCLICTTIIENGIDMPNVNTIIIENAQNFGLGQLHQLRGRVGRSIRQAYAHLFYKGSINLNPHTSQLEDGQENSEQVLKKVREKKYVARLKAIMESSELGAGFKLASRDLEIRGAGNILGKEQHGHIKNIGYGMYMTMLAEEIERLKALTE
ncbi:MAG: DEAD/DEAH box helicase [bacterium]